MHFVKNFLLGQVRICLPESIMTKFHEEVEWFTDSFWHDCMLREVFELRFDVSALDSIRVDEIAFLL